jgi:hypothetical protein
VIFFEPFQIRKNKMRTWRFDVDGKVKDALEYSDTYSLYGEEEVGHLSLGLYGPLRNAQKTKDEVDAILKTLKSKIQYHFSYICFFRGYVFPVKDSETRTLSALKYAKEKMKQNGLAFKMF